MATWYPIQSNFSMGEVSLQFAAQQDTQVFQQGLIECRNALPLSQGAVTTRQGSQVISEVINVDSPTTPIKNARIFPIELDAYTAGALIMTAGKASLLTSGSFESDLQVLKNPFFDEGLSDWDVQFVSSGSNYARVYPGESLGVSTMQITYNSTLNAIIHPVYYLIEQEIVLQDSQIGTENMVFRYRLFPVLVFSKDMPNPPPHAVIEIHINDGLVISQPIIYEEGELEDYSLTIPNTASMTPGDKIKVTIRNPDVTSRRYIVAFERIEIISKAIPAVESSPMDIPYSDEELQDVQYVSSPYGQKIVFVHENHPPHELFLNGSTWEFRPVPFTAEELSAPPPWFGAAADGSPKFPRAVGSFQGRLLLGGTGDDPQSVWGSKAGDWDEVGLVEDGTPDEPIAFTLNERHAINWIFGHRSLMIGTTANEYEIRASDGILKAGDIDARIQSEYGSAHIQPAGSGESIVAASGDYGTARGFSQDRDVMGWRGVNLSWTTDAVSKGIRRFSHSRDPARVLWAVLANGQLAGMSYEPSQGITGWHSHQTDGEFLDVCNVRSDDLDTTLLLVRRTIDNVTKVFLEGFQERFSSPDPTYMDCHKTQNFGDPVTVVTGLDYLEGREVAVLADGAVHDPVFVRDGTITLETPASIVKAGLAYTATVTTMPTYSPAQAGGLSSTKRWSEIGVRLLGSAMPIINGQRPPERPWDATMDKAHALHLGNAAVMGAGVDEFGLITIEQDLPLPLALGGIYGRMTGEKL